jgi:alpha-galactosidase
MVGENEPVTTSSSTEHRIVIIGGGAYVTLGTQDGSRPAGVRFAGLNENSQYRVRAAFPAGEPKFQQRANVQWLDGVELSGSALMHMGLRAPILFPDNAFLIEIEAI